MTVHVTENRFERTNGKSVERGDAEDQATLAGGTLAALHDRDNGPWREIHAVHRARADLPGHFDECSAKPRQKSHDQLQNGDLIMPNNEKAHKHGPDLDPHHETKEGEELDA